MFAADGQLLADGTVQHFDNGNLLTSTVPPSGAATTYTYDNRGNRTGAGGLTYDYDQANRLTNFTGPNANAQYSY